MNPFIEASGRWRDLHTNFSTVCREQLLSRLPAHYDADIEERVELLDQGDQSTQSYRPDVTVKRNTGLSHPAQSRSAIADLEPVTLRIPKVETESVGFIEIRTLPDSRLITVIEVLSPTNKREPDRSNYLAKMEHFRQAGVHLVEIDLLLDGTRLEALEPLPAGDYYAFVRRREQYPACDVYAWSMRRHLPRIPIPLNAPDPDVMLDLDEAFRTTFDRGGYSRRVRYDLALPGNPTAADRRWAIATAKKPA
jgi:hypothetical protein